ncbi:hypothetical protein KIPB_014562, partial [Kipferlia bialata]
LGDLTGERVIGTVQPLVFVGCGGTIEDPHFLGLFEVLSDVDLYPPEYSQQHFFIGLDPSVDPLLSLSLSLSLSLVPNY